MCCFSLFSACSDLEFREVANRLRDWFKALHESGSQNKKTKALLRPERSSKMSKFDMCHCVWYGILFPMNHLDENTYFRIYPLLRCRTKMRTLWLLPSTLITFCKEIKHLWQLWLEEQVSPQRQHLDSSWIERLGIFFRVLIEVVKSRTTQKIKVRILEYLDF